MLDEDYIARKAQDALNSYRKTHDLEFLVELYYCTLALIGDDFQLDITLEEFLNLNLFEFCKN